jgi:hypothetical protein
MVELLALLLHIRDISGPILAQRLASLTEDFHGFLQSLQENVGIVP